MTANVDIAMAAGEVLQALAMGETVESSEHRLVAPNCLQNRVLHMIDQEIAHARARREWLYWPEDELSHR